MTEKSEQLLNLPDGWIISTLGELTNIITGNTPPKNIASYYGSDFPFYKPADLNQQFVSQSHDGLSYRGKDLARSLPAGSILVTCIGSTIGKARLITQAGAFNQQINGIQTFGINPKYAYYQIISPSFQKLIKYNASATTVPILNKSKLSSIPFRLTNIREQNLIVEKIEEYFSELDKADTLLKNSIKRIGIYKEAILKDAFKAKPIDDLEADNLLVLDIVENIQKQKNTAYDDDLKAFKTEFEEWEKALKISKRPVRPSKPAPYINIKDRELKNLPPLPTSWVWEKLGNISFVTKLAGYEFSEHIKYESAGEIPVIKAQNISKNGFIDGNYSFVKKSILNELPRIKISGGELLFVFVGAGLGNVGIAPGSQFLLGPNVALIRLYQGVNNKYVQYFLSSLLGKQNITQLAKATAQGSISMENIREILFPLCQIKDQEKIVSYIEYHHTMADHMIAAIERNQAKIESVRLKILNTAFDGKLVESVDGKESVNSLIQEILAEKSTFLKNQQYINKEKAKPVKMAELKTILQILGESKGPVSAKEIWHSSIHKDDIDAFYAELKNLEDKLLVTYTDSQSLISLKNEN